MTKQSQFLSRVNSHGVDIIVRRGHYDPDEVYTQYDNGVSCKAIVQPASKQYVVSIDGEDLTVSWTAYLPHDVQVGIKDVVEIFGGQCLVGTVREQRDANSLVYTEIGLSDAVIADGMSFSRNYLTYEDVFVTSGGEILWI